MQNTKIEVPAVAWWVLMALLIPVLQTWIDQTFPGSAFAWAPLVVAVLGAVLKWISWVMAQNGQSAPAGAEGDVKPSSMSYDTSGEPWLEWSAPKRQFDVVDFLFGVKRV